MKIREKINMDYDGLLKNGPITIVAFGDSITHGALRDGEFNYETVYWNRLRKKLNNFRSYVPVNVINAGICGSTASASVGRIERDIIGHHPDLAIICFGLNDVNGELSDYTDSLGKIFDRCASAEIDTVFMTPNMLNTYVSDELEGWYREYAAVTAEFQTGGRLDGYIESAKAVAESRNIPICDVYGKWKKMSETEDTTALLSNRINHPIPEMHELFAEELYKLIMEK